MVAKCKAAGSTNEKMLGKESERQQKRGEVRKRKLQNANMLLRLTRHSEENSVTLQQLTTCMAPCYYILGINIVVDIPFTNN